MLLELERSQKTRALRESGEIVLPPPPSEVEADIGACRDGLENILRDLFGTEIAVATIRKRYFADHRVLFNEPETVLAEQLDVAQKLAQLFNQLPVVVGKQTRKIEIEKIWESAQKMSGEIVDTWREYPNNERHVLVQLDQEVEKILERFERARADFNE
jgi:hypothetical protein